MKSYFLSDIHLKAHQDPRMPRLARFFLEVPQKGDHVYLLGDIFDFWMGGHQIWLDRYADFVASIQDLRQRGVNVTFFEGNHDIHVDPFYKKLGVDVITEPKLLNIHGLKVRIEHGDLFNPDDTGYKFLRWFLRTSVLRWSSILAPGRMVTFFSDWGTQASHKRTSREGRRPEVIADIKRRMKIYAEKVLGEQEYDVLIMGHTHVREDYVVESNGRKGRFVNLGSWWEPEPKIFWLGEGSSGYL